MSDAADCGKIKINPSLGLAATKADLGGAWRAWTIARSINLQGTGRITRQELRQALHNKGVPKRNICRWIEEAINSGLFFLRDKHKKHLYLTGAGKVALILNVNVVSPPVFVNGADLFKRGWRSIVWAGYLATLKARPFSQEKKAEITGISPRVQRYYQAVQPGTKRGNFAKTTFRPDQIVGIKETLGGHYYQIGNEVVQKLPDSRIVPEEIAIPAKPGRVRKIRKLVNDSRFYEERVVRLFHHSRAAVDSTLRNLKKVDLLPWNLPSEVFKLKAAGSQNNCWLPTHTGVISW